jgi:hypothetical protein
VDRKSGKPKQFSSLAYSFSVADEHFNDLIRKGNKEARLIVVNPDIEAVVNRVCQTLDHDETGLQVANIQGLECLQDHRLTFVKAKAEQITSPLLDAILGR